jgi:putative flippase GtrA
MTALHVNSRELTRFYRFTVVGLIGAVVDFGTSNLLIHFLSFPLVLAGTISFIAAIISNFIWNHYWIYPDSRSKLLRTQLVQFAIVSVVGLMIRVPILAVLEPKLESLAVAWQLQIPGILNAKQLADNMTLAISVIVVMFWNFFANRYWTYGDVE